MADNKDIEKRGREKSLMPDEAYASWIEHLSLRYMQSQDLTRRLDRKGFSVTSLGYMRRFYLLYPDAITNLPSVGGEMDTQKNVNEICTCIVRKVLESEVQ